MQNILLTMMIPVITILILLIEGKITKEEMSLAKSIRSVILIFLFMCIIYKFFYVPILSQKSNGLVVSLPILPALVSLLIVGVIHIVLVWVNTSKIKVQQVACKKSSKKDKFILTFSCFIIALSSFIFGLTFFFMENFGEITFEQIMYNFTSPTIGVGGNMVISILLIPVFITVVPTAFYILLITNNRDLIYKGTTILSQKKISKILIVISFIALIASCFFAFTKLPVPQMIKLLGDDTTFIEENYVSPNDVKISPITKKRNLIHIYLESMENTYTTAENGGNETVDLIPELRELASTGTTFSDNDSNLGGPYQTAGSSWSVAGMVNAEAGIPLKISKKPGTSYGKKGKFLPGIVNLGDILEYYGYEQTIMFGADVEFGGLDVYYKTHGDYNLMDWEYAIEKGWLPKNYKENWGYEDKKLYEFAASEIVRLSKTNKPFNFTMETSDTHFPNGYTYADTPNAYENGVNNTYGNAIKFSSKHMGEFIEWIKKQPFYESTTIVISGDHLSMDKKYFENIDPDYHRTVYNTILNAPNDITESRTKNRKYSPSDFFPTILSSLGFEIEGNRLGLGTNLFSNEKTLIEKLGYEKYEEELSENSKFFSNSMMSLENNEFLPQK